ncbi:MAG: sulfite exporter TauE/SafE family protein [Chloroflexota bacterium]
MPDLSPTSLIIILLVSWAAGVAKVAFGIGAGVFLTPILALVLPPKVAVALMAPMMVITDVLALRHHWGKWHSRHILVLLPTAFVGIVVGTLFLTWAPTTLVRKAIGAIALLYVAIQIHRLRRPSGKPALPMPTWAGWIIGFFSGITTSVAHAGGIVMSIYLLSVGLTKEAFIASVVGAFSITDLVKISLYWQVGILTMSILLAGIALAPAMLLGGRMGIALNRGLSVQQFTTIVTVMVGAAGLLLLLT